MFYRNHEHYPDPTASKALTSIAKGEKSLFRPLVYVASAFRGNEKFNVFKARRYCKFAVKSGYIPIAPHIYFPQFLNDANPDERETAMEMNFALLRKCRELWIFGGKLTEGMRREYDLARKLNKKIRYFNENMEEIL